MSKIRNPGRRRMRDICADCSATTHVEQQQARREARRARWVRGLAIRRAELATLVPDAGGEWARRGTYLAGQIYRIQMRLGGTQW